MTDIPATLTLAQFVKARRAAYLAENPDITGAAYDRGSPLAWRATEWVDSLIDVARSRQPIPARVLDDLFNRYPLAYRSIYHDHGNTAIPAGYLCPEARRINNVWDEERRADRRRGRKEAAARTTATIT